MFADCLLCQVLFQTRVYKGVSRADKTPGPHTAYGAGDRQTNPGGGQWATPQGQEGQALWTGQPSGAGWSGRAVGEATTEVTEGLTFPAACCDALDPSVRDGAGVVVR